MNTMNKTPLEKLSKKNFTAALAHLGSFLILIVLLMSYKTPTKYIQGETFRYAIPIPNDPANGHIPVGGNTCNSNGYSLVPINSQSGQCNVNPAYAPPMKKLSFNIIYGCLLFFAITAFAHLFYATDGFGSGKYSKVISEGWNPYRWVEYGLSASIMTVLIANTLGIKDFNHILSLVFINVAMQVCGFLVENALIQREINTTTIKASTFAGWVLLSGIWIPILIAMRDLFKDVKDNYTGILDPVTNKPIEIPTFVWIIIFSQIINFSCFGVAQLLQVRDGLNNKLKPFEVYESRYLTLSFVGKLALAGALSYGLIFRTKDCT